MSIHIRDVSDLPFHVGPRLGVGVLHAGDDTFADVDVDDRLDPAVVNVGGETRVAATDVQNRVLGSYVFVEDAAQLRIFAIPETSRIKSGKAYSSKLLTKMTVRFQ